MLDKLVALLLILFCTLMLAIALFYIFARNAIMCFGDDKWREIVFKLPDGRFLPDEYMHNIEQHCTDFYSGMIFIPFLFFIYFIVWKKTGRRA